jgi:hypothetical protein
MDTLQMHRLQPGKHRLNCIAVKRLSGGGLPVSVAAMHGVRFLTPPRQSSRAGLRADWLQWFEQAFGMCPD